MTSHGVQQHLVIESKGLFCGPKNWEVMNKRLTSKLDQQHYLVHASEGNQLFLTFEGIDACGERLAAEIKEIAHANPSLRYISMLGHSMGGLMLRYAAGQLYDPGTGLMAARLEPMHFITMASPHLGCDVEGESQRDAASVNHITRQNAGEGSDSRAEELVQLHKLPAAP